MRRTVIFVTLALLLLAVAGVTAAQEGAFQNDEPTESTAEATSPEITTPENDFSGSTSPEGTAFEGTTGGTEPDTEAQETAALGVTNSETRKPEQPEQRDEDASEKESKARGVAEPKDKRRVEPGGESEEGGG